MRAGRYPYLAQSTAWPTKSVRILVGSAPGGGTDAMARAVADRLGPLLKQPVVVENRPGVSNTLAADVTAKSNDGHTLVMGVSTAHAIAPHLIKLGYDSNKDLVPVAFVGAVPNVLVVTNSVPVDSVESLVKLAKSKPGQLNYATSGAGSTQHIAAEMFKDATGVFITHIPYKRQRPGAGRPDRRPGADELRHPAFGHRAHQGRQDESAGRGKRQAQSRSCPTCRRWPKPACKGVEMSAWYGMYMPAATPKATCSSRVHDEVNKVLAMPETKTRLDAIGAEITPMTQAQFAQFHAAEYKRFGELIKKKNIRMD